MSDGAHGAHPKFHMVADRYELGALLGEGGLGFVHVAWDHRLKRQVAIKRLRHDDDPAGRILERGIQEALTLASAQHPNIVTVFDYGADADGPFVVMEYVQGETLEHRIARRPFDEANFMLLARQTLEGLVAAHSKGVIHRDLKPSNLMLAQATTGVFQVKILDFGLAKVINRPSVQSGAEGGSVFGSIFYMAPEQFNRQPIDARTDLYALGCIFYEALSGALPFGGEMVAEVMASHLAHNVIPLGQRCPELSTGLADWVMRLIAYRANDRPPHAAAALSALHRLSESATGMMPLPAPAPPVVARRGLMPWIAGATLLGMLAAGGLGWFWVAERPAPTPTAVEKEEQTEPTTFDPNDLVALRPWVGREVTLQGRPSATGISRNGEVMYLNFHHDYRQAANLVFFSRDHPGLTRESLETWVGRPVRVTGVLEEFRGNLQIAIAQITQLEDATGF